MWRAGPFLRWGAAVSLVILIACCFLVAGAAWGDGGSVEVSVRVAPTIQITGDGSVRSNSTVKTQVVNGLLTIVHL